jgi:hypothetical protein
VSYPPGRPSVPRGVYTIFALVGLVVVAASIALPTPAQTQLTINPAMSKGPAGAPVTILEFSDYQ